MDVQEARGRWCGLPVLDRKHVKIRQINNTLVLSRILVSSVHKGRDICGLYMGSFCRVLHGTKICLNH